MSIDLEAAKATLRSAPPGHVMTLLGWALVAALESARVERARLDEQVERLRGIVLALSAEDTGSRYRTTLDGLAAHDAEHQPGSSRFTEAE